MSMNIDEWFESRLHDSERATMLVMLSDGVIAIYVIWFFEPIYLLIKCRTSTAQICIKMCVCVLAYRFCYYLILLWRCLRRALGPVLSASLHLVRLCACVVSGSIHFCFLKWQTCLSSICWSAGAKAVRREAVCVVDVFGDLHRLSASCWWGICPGADWLEWRRSWVVYLRYALSNVCCWVVCFSCSFSCYSWSQAWFSWVLLTEWMICMLILAHFTLISLPFGWVDAVEWREWVIVVWQRRVNVRWLVECWPSFLCTLIMHRWSGFRWFSGISLVWL